MDKKPAVSIICILAVAAVVFGCLYFSNSSQNEKLRASLKEENLVLRQEADQLRAEAAARTQEAESLRDEAANAAEQKAVLEADMAAQTEKIRTLEEAAAKRETQIARFQTEFFTQAAEMDKLRADLDQCMAENSELGKHLNESQAMLDQAIAENTGLETSIAEMEAEIERLRAIIEEYEKSNWFHPDPGSTQKKIEEMENLIAELQCQLEEKLAYIAAQEEDIAKLKTRIAELEGTAEKDPSLPAQP